LKINLVMNRWQYAIGSILICWLLISTTNNEGLIAKNITQTQYDPHQWVELPATPKTDKSRRIDLDFTYATTNNFVNTKLYQRLNWYKLL
jgi:hypothetical protein